MAHFYGSNVTTRREREDVFDDYSGPDPGEMPVTAAEEPPMTTVQRFAYYKVIESLAGIYRMSNSEARETIEHIVNDVIQGCKNVDLREHLLDSFQENAGIA